MKLIFLYGQVASGKLTVAKALAARTGFALFHNHLVVDAVAAVFPFGSAEFASLRERFWLDMVDTAARGGQSLIMTFAPEPTVAPDLPRRLIQTVEAAGGRVDVFALTVSAAEQESRLVAEDRAAFGKLRSVEVLRRLRPEFEACMREMPTPLLVIDTMVTDPTAAADAIVQAMSD